MNFRFTKAFFVPLVVLVSVLTLTSCGKDYDIVSEYVVREPIANTSTNSSIDSNSFGLAVINDIATASVKKK